MSSPTFAYLVECFSYNADDGTLVWKPRPRHHFKTDRAWKLCIARDAGRVASGRDAYGYLTVRISGKRYKAHRIAWAMINSMNLSEVPAEIDHINLVKDDNREENLRPATGSQNRSNTGVRADNSSGHKGVDFHNGNNRWRARIMRNGRSFFLGWFDTADEAAAARLLAQPLHGEYARLSANDNATTMARAA